VNQTTSKITFKTASKTPAMNSFMPRIEIALSQIEHNTRVLCERYGSQGISLMGVSKATLGDPAIARAMVQGGVQFIADSRIENIQRMKIAGVKTQFVLLRSSFSQAERIVLNADISLNTEWETLSQLSHYSVMHNRIHQVIVMVEMGDLREGVLPRDLSQLIQRVMALPNLKLVGLGCNLACYGGIKPDARKMRELSELTIAIETEFNLKLSIVSGGNSANYEWFEAAQRSGGVGRINNLRLGESILLGREAANREIIPGLYTQAFQLMAEVVESKDKPSLPYGDRCQDSFGNSPTFENRGDRQRVIVALGKQDTGVAGLGVESGFEILGSSSDHVILDHGIAGMERCAIGSAVRFDVDYGSLLAAMTSPFVQKQFL
jgi:ornithine racemase